MPWHPARTGERFEIDSVRGTVLHPTPAWRAGARTSTRTRWSCWWSTATFRRCSQATPASRPRRTWQGHLRHVDLLKVGHHGSRGSTSDAWLDALAPAVAIISLGRNDYGHPAPATLARLRAHGVDVHRTDLEGTVTVVTDGRADDRTVPRRHGRIRRTLTVHPQSPRGIRADVGHDHRAVHSRSGRPLSRGDG